jgi:diguanylate cyclase (GGDEF)-like protein
MQPTEEADRMAAQQPRRHTTGTSTDPGRALGIALATRAGECCELCSSRAARYSWEGNQPSAEYVEKVRGINWLATLLVARWLAYRVPVSAEEMSYISERGDIAASEQQSIVNVTRAYLVWRDTVCEIIQEEADRMEIARDSVSSARHIVWVSCDAGLVQVARAFDTRMRHLAEDLAVEREALQHLALHDALTGLPNRVLILDRINQAVLAAKRNELPFAVLSVDLDGFKDVNDSFGHSCGDLVLQQISSRLVGAVRESDTVGRWGGDEFVVVHAGAGADAAHTMARRLEAVVRQPLRVAGQQVTVGATIGVATYPAAGEDVHSLLNAADREMYRVKRERVA